MRRNESQLRQAGSNEEAAGIPQVVAVAIDNDKNSQHAIKWAADHVLKKGEIFILLHVRRKVTTIPTSSGLQIPISDIEDEVSSAYLEQIDLQTKELLPFQRFCSRRGLQCKEVIMNASDVPKAIIDFVMHQGVDKLVLGSSNRNAFMRAFTQMDVPTTVSKTAPEFCSVFVITKGRISSYRPATHSKKHLDEAGEPLLQWDRKANRVSFSTLLPTWMEQDTTSGEAYDHSFALCSRGDATVYDAESTRTLAHEAARAQLLALELAHMSSRRSITLARNLAEVERTLGLASAEVVALKQQLATAEALLASRPTRVDTANPDISRVRVATLEDRVKELQAENQQLRNVVVPPPPAEDIRLFYSRSELEALMQETARGSAKHALRELRSAGLLKEEGKRITARHVLPELFG